MMKTILVLGAFLLSTLPAQAAVSPVSFNIVPPIELPPSDFSITGLRLSALWGKHRSVYGFDFGAIGNITEQNFAGIAVSGIFNSTQGLTTIVGLQLAGAANINTNKTKIFGLQAAVGVNSNSGESLIVGLQLAALANLSAHTTIGGAQIGLYNKAREVYGFQIGLLNDTEYLHGIQIGLLNFNRRGLFSVAPILNVGF